MALRKKDCIVPHPRILINVLSLDLSQPSFMKEVDFYRFSFRHLSDVYFIDPVFKRLGLIKLYYFE